MHYEETWKVLADLVTELRKKGEVIPANVMNDLRSAKTMMHVLKADPTHIENIPRIEAYLENVESYLISVAQEKFGSEFVEQWMKRLEKATKKTYEEEAKTVSRFVPGIPRGEHWVRVQISDDTPQGEIKKLAEENGLSHKIQKNGYMLVYGDSESIKSFVKKMAEKLRSARKQ